MPIQSNAKSVRFVEQGKDRREINLLHQDLLWCNLVELGIFIASIRIRRRGMGYDVL